MATHRNCSEIMAVAAQTARRVAPALKMNRQRRMDDIVLYSARVAHRRGIFTLASRRCAGTRFAAARA
jgi:hypothetical protein